MHLKVLEFFKGVYEKLVAQFLPSRTGVGELTTAVERLAVSKVKRLGKKIHDPTGVIVVRLGRRLSDEYGSLQSELQQHLSDSAAGAAQKAGAPGKAIMVSIGLSDKTQFEVEWVPRPPTAPHSQRDVAPEDATRKATLEEASAVFEWVGGPKMAINENIRLVGGGERDYLKVPGLPAGALEVRLERSGAVIIRCRRDLDVRLDGRLAGKGAPVTVRPGGATASARGEVVGFGNFDVRIGAAHHPAARRG